MASGELGTVLEDCLKKINANTAQPDNFLRCVCYFEQHLFKGIFRMLQRFGVCVFGLELANPSDSIKLLLVCHSERYLTICSVSDF